MNNKLLNYWARIHSSFWFVPTLMAIGAVLLAFVMLAVDGMSTIQPNGGLSWLYMGGAEGARGLLSSIAGSSITVAGTIFSITIAALTLASSNYGPRLLRNFTSDTGNQVVLGTFVGTFIYSLIVLRSVRDINEITFVPHLSTSVAMLLALVNIAVLIYFIHHISTSIMVSNIVAEVADDLNDTIDRIFPERIGRGEHAHESLHGDRDVPERFDEESAPVASKRSGYVQTLDEDKLMELTTKHGLIVRVDQRPGQFVVDGNALVRVWPGGRVNDELSDAINNAYAIGKQRTIIQDVEFAMLQIVEVAVRALSPSLNDPYTAINCIDQLSSALCHLAVRQFPSRYRYDEHNRLRVVASPVTFDQLVDVAFDQIRMNGGSFVMVLHKILVALDAIATRVQSPEELDTLRRQALLVELAGRDGIVLAADRKSVEKQLALTLRSIREREMALETEHAPAM